MPDLDALLSRLEELVDQIEGFDEPVRKPVYELLDGIDALHRLALTRLSESLDRVAVARLREADAAIGWLFDAYGVGLSERGTADAALARVRPYVEGHGGRVEVLEADRGVVRVRLSGSCSGCTASAATLQDGVEAAFREAYPGFVRMEVEPDGAAPHPPPAPTLLQIGPRPPDA